jgi:transposase
MSTKNLQIVVDKYNLYTAERKTETLAEVLAAMREDIQLEMVSADVFLPG